MARENGKHFLFSVVFFPLFVGSFSLSDSYHFGRWNLVSKVESQHNRTLAFNVWVPLGVQWFVPWVPRRITCHCWGRVNVNQILRAFNRWGYMSFSYSAVLVFRCLTIFLDEEVTEDGICVPWNVADQLKISRGWLCE